MGFVAVLRDAGCGEVVRCGPLDFAGFKAIGQLPLDRRGKAGAAGVGPVDVPFGFQVDHHGHVEGLAGGDGLVFGDQVGFGGLRLCCGAVGKENSGGQ